jgi:hypothetical protein
MYVSSTESECCNLHVCIRTEPECYNLHVRIRHLTWTLSTCTYLALNLNYVTYMYVSGTEPECCDLYVRIWH